MARIALETLPSTAMCVVSCFHLLTLTPFSGFSLPSNSCHSQLMDRWNDCFPSRAQLGTNCHLSCAKLHHSGCPTHLNMNHEQKLASGKNITMVLFCAKAQVCGLLLCIPQHLMQPLWTGLCPGNPTYGSVTCSSHHVITWHSALLCCRSEKRRRWRSSAITWSCVCSRTLTRRWLDCVTSWCRCGPATSTTTSSSTLWSSAIRSTSRRSGATSATSPKLQF